MAAGRAIEGGGMDVRRAYFGHALKRAGTLLPGVLFAALSPMAMAQSADGKAGFSPLLSTYCAKCHNSEDWAGSLAFDTIDVGHAGDDPQIWEKVITKLR